jgi:Ca2+/Na+ antiporter
MQPLTVVLGIVLGSVFSVAFGLGIVWLIFGLRQGEDSRYAMELPELARATVLFSLVTVVSALSFVGSLRSSAWRRWPILGLMIGLVGIGFYYWPA